METSDKNYGYVFILSQETLACVSFSRPAIRTIVREIHHLP